ncbi:MAG: cell division protein FtsQ/DivIB [Rhodospirillaceae bacterium]|jgi:cell division protein FtsQ
MKLFRFKSNQTKPKKGQPRKRVVPIWRRPWAAPVAIAVTISFLAGSSWWVFQSGQAERWVSQAKWHVIAVSGRLGFTVQDILVEGRRETKQTDLLKAIRLARGAPIFAFDLDAARERVEALPWVRHATIQRQLPDTIYLRITERRPLALWQHKRRFSLIDETGSVITRKNIARFSGLLVVVGKKAPKHASGIIRVLSTEPGLLKKVKAAVWVGDRRWNIRLTGGIDVRLPEDNPAGAWQRLAEYDHKHNVLSRNVTVLDLRQPDRLIVRTRAQPDKQIPARKGRET